MNKVTLDNKAFISPLPALLIGSVVDNKPNYMTAAWASIATAEPPMTTLGIEPNRYTYRGILQNMTFSVNVPSRALVEEVDLCGRESGSAVDKVKACHFRLFYGKMKAAPLIEQCPVNLEYR
jgi:flavin reductase (DIM6/NTAB) family NADH-FMN oxidoreductase RutF